MFGEKIDLKGKILQGLFSEKSYAILAKKGVHRNITSYSHSMLYMWLLLYEVGRNYPETHYIVVLSVLYGVSFEKLVKNGSRF